MMIPKALTKKRVLLLFTCNLTIVIVYLLLRPNQECSHVQTKANVRPMQHKIILLSYMRSGSTLTGTLFSVHPDVFYVYEPLWTLRQAYEGQMEMKYLDGTVRRVKQSKTFFLAESERIIHCVLNCHFQSLDVGTLTQTHMLRSESTMDYAMCVNITWKASAYIVEEEVYKINECLHLLTSSCLHARVIAMKVIEAAMSRTESMLASETRLKVIHLIRDPRGVLNSRIAFGMINSQQMTRHSTSLCKRVLNDIERSQVLSKRYPERVLTVRYEDIARAPILAAHQLYDFSELEISAEFDILIWNMTYAGFADGCNVCPVRGNASRTASLWRKQLSYALVSNIQHQCATLLEVMGYTTFHSEHELSNMSVSLTNERLGPGLKQVQISGSAILTNSDLSVE